MHPANLSKYKESPLYSAESNKDYFVLFRVGGQIYALPLEQVVRVLRMVAITPVPEMSERFLGAINIAGQTLTVLSMRRLLGQQEKECELQDRILVIKQQKQTLGAVVDEVLNIIEYKQEQGHFPSNMLADSRLVSGTIQYDDKLIMVLDADRLFQEKSEDNPGQVIL